MRRSIGEARPLRIALPVVAGFVAVAGAACSPGHGHRAAPPSTTGTAAPPATAAPSTTAAPPVRPSVASGTLVRKGPGYRVDVKYPRLVGLTPLTVEDLVNRTIEHLADTDVAAFVSDATKASGSSVPGDSPPTEATSTFETALLDNRLVSLRLVMSEYFAGAAHPTSHLVPLNFDARTGRQYRMADLFAPGARYLARLSQLSRPALAKLLGPDADAGTINEGTTPTAENFEGWSVSPGGLDVTFGEYQVGPYAIGMPRITIPLAAVRDIVAPAGPLGGRG